MLLKIQVGTYRVKRLYRFSIYATVRGSDSAASEDGFPPSRFWFPRVSAHRIARCAGSMPSRVRPVHLDPKRGRRIHAPSLPLRVAPIRGLAKAASQKASTQRRNSSESRVSRAENFTTMFEFEIF